VILFKEYLKNYSIKRIVDFAHKLVGSSTRSVLYGRAGISFNFFSLWDNVRISTI